MTLRADDLGGVALGELDEMLRGILVKSEQLLICVIDLDGLGAAVLERDLAHLLANE